MKRDDLFMKLTGLYFSFCVVLLHYQPNFGYQNIAVTQLRWMPAFLGYGFLAVNCGAFCKGFKRWALCGLLAVGGVENLISFIGLLCGKKWGFLPEAAMLGHLAALAALFLWVRNCHGQMQTRCGISWVVAILAAGVLDACELVCLLLPALQGSSVLSLRLIPCVGLLLALYLLHLQRAAADAAHIPVD